MAQDELKGKEDLGQAQNFAHKKGGEKDGDDDHGGGQEDLGIIGDCIAWLMMQEKKPPLPWATNRAEEIEAYLDSRNVFPTNYFSRNFWYNRYRVRRTAYHGDRDINQERDMRGIGIWPDPPTGGGESYYGLWRQNQAHIPEPHEKRNVTGRL